MGASTPQIYVAEEVSPLAKVVLAALILIALSLAIPQTRPKVIEHSEPVLYPVFMWQVKSEMERIGGEVTSFENQYYKLPTSPAKFNGWLATRFTEEKARTDSWGTEYRFKIWPDSFAIISAGPDRVHVTEDDIQYAKLRLERRLNER